MLDKIKKLTKQEIIELFKKQNMKTSVYKNNNKYQVSIYWYGIKTYTTNFYDKEIEAHQQAYNIFI